MKRTVWVAAAIVGSAALTLLGMVLWKDLNKNYVIGWSMPLRAKKPTLAGRAAGGNVCIVPGSNPRSQPSVCAEIAFFPEIYAAIGVDQHRLIKWQEEYGFDSGGVDPTGTLLAPGYPMFSRLAWTVIDPVYLKGDELLRLVEECKRIYTESNTADIKAKLEMLSALATQAHQESQVLRIG